MLGMQIGAREGMVQDVHHTGSLYRRRTLLSSSLLGEFRLYTPLRDHGLNCYLALATLDFVGWLALMRDDCNPRKSSEICKRENW